MLASLLLPILLAGFSAGHSSGKLSSMPGAGTPECVKFHQRCSLVHQANNLLCQGDAFCINHSTSNYYNCISTCGQGDRNGTGDLSTEGSRGPGYEELKTSNDPLRLCLSPIDVSAPMPGASTSECAQYHRKCHLTLQSCLPLCDNDNFCRNGCTSKYHLCVSTCGKGDREVEGQGGGAPENGEMGTTYGTQIPGHLNSKGGHGPSEASYSSGSIPS
ncbi:hypothetical protein K7432_000591 [Basidiobolus ranarum]|uniref:WAP domain-containing protein n=1 Tax=Basidiobolus ranarum TaxID=34480 RepID=A0ABR2WB10_9FUNG